MPLNIKEYRMNHDVIGITHELECWLNQPHYSPSVENGYIVKLNNIPFEKILEVVVKREKKSRFGSQDKFLFELAMAELLITS